MQNTQIHRLRESSILIARNTRFDSIILLRSKRIITRRATELQANPSNQQFIGRRRRMSLQVSNVPWLNVQPIDIPINPLQNVEQPANNANNAIPVRRIDPIDQEPIGDENDANQSEKSGQGNHCSEFN